MSRSNGRGDLPDAYRFEEVERRLDHTVRIGTVYETDYGRMPQARVRVLLDGWPSAWLPIATCRNGPNGEWDPPEVDEQVIVVAPSGTTAGAYVLGTLPRDLFPVHDYAERNPARHLRWYEDDTTLLYDREQHLWELKNPNADGRHHLLITENSEIEQTNERIFLRINETSIEITDGQIRLSVGEETTVMLTDGLLEVDAELSHFTGDVVIDGALEVGGATTVTGGIATLGNIATTAAINAIGAISAGGLVNGGEIIAAGAPLSAIVTAAVETQLAAQNAAGPNPGGTGGTGAA
ncbi:MAG TPA: phage baseplate assembly protein V [Gaiellales bacterium]|nr:phage baseplate assembly protein V [Gaiellales bacterium]